MHSIRWRMIFALCLSLAFALLSGLLLGSTAGLIIFAGCLLAILIQHYLHWEALDTWLHQPTVETVPHGGGMWEDTFASLYQLVRQQNSSRQHLNHMLERFQRAADAMPDGIVILDSQDLIEWCNPVAENHLGLNLQHDRGHPVNYLVRQAQFTDYLAAHNYSEPLLMRSMRNPDLHLAIQLIPFGDKQKLLLTRDISMLERADVMRRDFVANVSHELRTPLTVIHGFLETFLDMDPGNKEDIQHYCRLMLDQSHRMLRLVEALLALSRLENAQNPPQKTDIDIPAMMEQLLKEAQSLSNGRHEIRLELRSGQHVQGNEDELHSAFSNLITNAVRYTPEGGAITLAWEDCGNEACYRVKDTGIGIEPEHINRLTERFYRVDKSRSRATGGTGLGLSIVKHVLNRHQGQLRIESQPGKGSTFSACLPLPPALPGDHSVAAEAD